MKKRILVAIFLICFMPMQVFGLSLSCRSCVLLDSESGRVLYEKDKDTPRLIASITKIMTSILAIESGKLNEEVTVGEEVLKMYGSNIYIELGEKMILRDMVYGLMLRSGNDAAIVIATYIGGDEKKFVDMMNQKAKEIGMKNTIFKNSHGLDEETQNYSTAYDMALLSSYAFQNEEYRKIVGTKKYTVQTDKKSYVWYNRNKLLSLYEYATGGKTGYTPSAGRTLVTNAEKNNLKLTAVTLHDGNEYDTHQTLYDYGFQNYKNYVILDPDKFKIDDGFFKDRAYIKNKFTYPLTEDEKEEVKVFIKLQNRTKYQEGEQIGEVSVFLAEKEIYKDQVYAHLNPIKKGIWQKIKEFFK